MIFTKQLAQLKTAILSSLSILLLRMLAALLGCLLGFLAAGMVAGAGLVIEVIARGILQSLSSNNLPHMIGLAS